MEFPNLLDLVSARERRRILPYCREVELAQNEVLLEAGQPIGAVWFPRNCVTSTVVTATNGETIEVGLMGFDGMVGLSLALGKNVSNTSVMCSLPGIATRIAAADFEREVVLPRSELFELVLKYTDAFMAMIAQTAACNSLHSIDERLARWILMVHDRVFRPEMRLTQDFLAYMLGVRRASVSLAASALQQRGLIHYRRGTVRIVDRNGLEHRTCECYRIVRTIADGVSPRAVLREGA